MIILKSGLLFNTSDFFHIYTHLCLCNSLFTPALSTVVDIKEYSKKLSTKATRFEYWNSNNLVGLIAAYENYESSFLYITNVSIIPAFQGKGLARKLLSECIALSRRCGFNNILLEVNKKNLGAINLYVSFGFSYESEKNNLQTMNLILK